MGKLKGFELPHDPVAHVGEIPSLVTVDGKSRQQIETDFSTRVRRLHAICFGRNHYIFYLGSS